VTRMLLLFLTLPIVVTTLVACGARDTPLQVLGTVERDRLELIAESNERIVEIAVHEGDRVAAGALLLRQEAGTMQARLDAARAGLVEAQRRLADLVEGPRRREIDDARAVLAGAESTLRTEESEYKRIQDLVERELTSQSSADQTRMRRDAARAQRDSARARLGLLQQGTRTEQLAEARAAADRAAAGLAEIETVAARYVLRAPRAGLVEALPFKLGERPAAGLPLAILLAEGVPYARVYVPEPMRSRFAAGARVEATVDGEPHRFGGTVRYVSAEAAFTPYYALTQKDRSRLSYLAEVTLDDPRAANLPAGVPVQVYPGRASRTE
jgi:HlyD family secretion protein